MPWLAVCMTHQVPAERGSFGAFLKVSQQDDLAIQGHLVWTQPPPLYAPLLHPLPPLFPAALSSSSFISSLSHFQGSSAPCFCHKYGGASTGLVSPVEILGALLELVLPHKSRHVTQAFQRGANNMHEDRFHR